MGQEVSLAHFDADAFEHFYRKLEQETRSLGQLIATKNCSERQPVAGFEIEAWLIDAAMQAAPINEHFLTTLKDPLACAELAKFNIEFNSTPIALNDNVFSRMHTQLQSIWDKAYSHAENLNCRILMTGSLPTLQATDLNLGNMSNLNRYRALNEQILQARGKPIHLDINGVEHLKMDHDDVMLESATTSFQIHTQVPLAIAHCYYNAAIIASAPLAALCANTPFLFGKQLWHESRIPLFEQAIETGGFADAAQGPLKRVSFGSDYARKSIMECFQENLDHFPVLLPENLDSADAAFAHLRLHNGTIWRWNRPLLGFDEDGTAHIRIEHRVPAAGPSVLDTIANAAVFYGLTKNLCDEMTQHKIPLPFAQARDNFYQAARYGLNANVIWFDGHKQPLLNLLQSELLQRARLGLKSLGVATSDSEDYLDIIRQRLATQRNGSLWQREFMATHPGDFTLMTRHYLKNQNSGKPVSEWTIN
ncbi:MAG: glutamate--cysteine ligase [Gammaproteobacteria bacterium HGW-Gammaproteobacteria-3]|nr:MAG: glutamate--cysteine ligase [Gammaproteobacteria bacterium HGW-Gammaproteobacteria-3]